MTGRSIVWLLGVVFAVGCGDAPTRSEAVLSDSSLVEVLIDFHLADARARYPDEVPGRMRDSILAHHGIDSAAFGRTMDGYLERPEALIVLYNTVLDRMNADRLSFPATPIR